MKPIAISLSPNTEADDVRLALNILLHPQSWKQGDAIKRVEKWFLNESENRFMKSFNSGRSALLAILHAFEIGSGDEVIVQAFTCVAVPNSVLWSGATPIFVDIDDTYNIDCRILEKAITKKTKAIIVQHTFGIPANMQEIQKITKKHGILLIEDCAHALGATYAQKELGLFGDAAFFSFGRDKIISSVFGGMASIASRHTDAVLRLSQYHKALPMPTRFWIFQQLFHPIAFALILATYSSGIGKAILVFLQHMHLLSFPVYPEEKLGKQPKDFPAQYPNALAHLLLNQLPKLIRYNTQRKEIASFYKEKLARGSYALVKEEIGACYLRFPVRTAKSKHILLQAKKQGILLGNWYHAVIDPVGVDFSVLGYTPGSCPNAEKAAKECLNLPTLISKNQAQKIIDILSA